MRASRRLPAGASSDELSELKDKVADVSKDVAVVCEKVAGLEKTSDSTAAGVKRIEGYFLQKGIDGR